MNKKDYWYILKDFDPDTNQRDIVFRAICKFKSTPSPYWANRLEEYGIAVDFNNLDNGN